MRRDLVVLVDGGVRSGVDVLKMLALGAHAVLVGRPLATGAIGAGADGVRLILEQMRNELKVGHDLHRLRRRGRNRRGCALEVTQGRGREVLSRPAAQRPLLRRCEAPRPQGSASRQGRALAGLAGCAPGQVLITMTCRILGE